SAGFNVIVGQNNVGKTALLEALGLEFESRPFRDASAKRDTPLDPASRVEVTLTFTGNELRNILLGLPSFEVPIPDALLNKGPAVEQLLERLCGMESLSIKASRASVGRTWQLLEFSAYTDASVFWPESYLCAVTPSASENTFATGGFLRRNPREHV